MDPFKVKGKHQFACAVDRNPPLSDYDGMEVTFCDENGGWLYSCDVGVPGPQVAKLRNQNRWSEELKAKMIHRRIEQIMEESKSLPTGPVPDLKVDGHGIYLTRES